jgi:hypothetical protein
MTCYQTACGKIGEQATAKFMSNSWTENVSNDKKEARSCIEIGPIYSLSYIFNPYSPSLEKAFLGGLVLHRSYMLFRTGLVKVTLQLFNSLCKRHEA